MKRSADLNVLSRRDLFALAGCAGLAALAACTDGSNSGVQTGPLGGTPDGHEPGDGPTAIDGHSSQHDASVDAALPADAGIVATCTGSETDVGAPATFQTGVPIYFSSGKFFVVRDAGGLYAMTAACTHEGATCSVSGSSIRCPRHGALFKYDGTIISGPVSQPLSHYAMCTLANGHVGVIRTAVSKSQRLDV